MGNSEWIAFGSFVVAAIALVGTAVGYLLNRTGVQEAAAKAERATVAAERSAVALERSARAQELQMARAAAISPTPKAAWQMSRHNGDVFILENVGTAPAYDVEVRAVHPNLHVMGITQSHGDEVKPGEAVKFHAFVSLATSDDRVMVRWGDAPQEQDRHEWTRALPPA
jgi:hypothetical protein